MRKLKAIEKKIAHIEGRKGGKGSQSRKVALDKLKRSAFSGRSGVHQVYKAPVEIDPVEDVIRRLSFFVINPYTGKQLTDTDYEGYVARLGATNDFKKAVERHNELTLTRSIDSCLMSPAETISLNSWYNQHIGIMDLMKTLFDGKEIDIAHYVNFLRTRYGLGDGNYSMADKSVVHLDLSSVIITESAKRVLSDYFPKAVMIYAKKENGTIEANVYAKAESTLKYLYYQLMSNEYYVNFQKPSDSFSIGRFDSENWPAYEMICLEVEPVLLKQVQGINVNRFNADRMDPDVAHSLRKYKVKSPSIRDIITQELK